MRWVILCLYLALAGAAVATALVSAEGSGARARVVAAEGAFALSSSADGEPIFTASEIGPGDSASGTVEVAAGEAAAELTLSQHDLEESPGLGGGLLSDWLTLRVRELAPTARTVYSGPLATMPPQELGRIDPGASRRFEFVATLPEVDPGVSQDEVQGASTSIAFSWAAREASPEPPATGGSRPGQGDAGGGSGSGPPVAAPAPLELKVIRVRHRVRHGRVLVWARCDRACAVIARGRLRARSGHGHRAARVRLRGAPLRTGQQRLRIKLPPPLRRWLRQHPGPARLRGHVVLRARDETGASTRVKRKLRLRIVR